MYMYNVHVYNLVTCTVLVLEWVHQNAHVHVHVLCMWCRRFKHCRSVYSLQHIYMYNYCTTCTCTSQLWAYVIHVCTCTCVAYLSGRDETDSTSNGLASPSTLPSATSGITETNEHQKPTKCTIRTGSIVYIDLLYKQHLLHVISCKLTLQTTQYRPHLMLTCSHITLYIHVHVKSTNYFKLLLSQLLSRRLQVNTIHQTSLWGNVCCGIWMC